MYDYFEAFSIISYRLATNGQFATTWTKKTPMHKRTVKDYTRKIREMNLSTEDCQLSVLTCLMSTSSSMSRHSSQIQTANAKTRFRRLFHTCAALNEHCTGLWIAVNGLLSD